MHWTRRRLVVWGSALVSWGSLLPLASVLATRRPRPPHDLGRVVFACFPKPHERPAARRLGERCLASVPTAKRTSLSAIADGLLSEIPGDATPSQLRAHFSARREDDLRNGRIWNVEGWILAQTEAQLFCAALLEGAGEVHHSG